MSRFILFLALLLALPLPATAYDANQPVEADSRIKTFVYNDYEVYTLTVHYGYQANIEFGPHEDIQTISIGDKIAWQLIPAGRRLFIRATEDSAHTNMTVVTSKRTYQFDLTATPTAKDNRLVYVVRFYYPDEQPRTQGGGAAAAYPVTSTINAGDMFAASAPSQAMNFNYTFTGPQEIAPTRIYDDGRATYFQFRNMQGQLPVIMSVRPDGTEVPLPYTLSNGYAVVATTSPRFSVRQGDKIVCVYNENAQIAMGR